MKLYTKTGSESDIKKEERSLIMGGYSKSDKTLGNELQPFEYIWTNDAEAAPEAAHKISWLE